MIFDTDVLIWAARGDASASRFIERSLEKQISVVTLMELLQGAQSKAESRYIRQMLTDLGFQTLPLSEAIGSRAAGLIERYSLGHGIQVVDALIAATALEAGKPLCTGNLKHFRPLQSLSLVPFRQMTQR